VKLIGDKRQIAAENTAGAAAACADCAVSDGGDFTETSATSQDDDLEANITSHLTSARHMLDDINDRVIALKPSDGTDEEVTVNTVTSVVCTETGSLFI